MPIEVPLFSKEGLRGEVKFYEKIIMEKDQLKKIRVGILFGGRSAEHEVSLQSAKYIIKAIDTDKYDVVLIGIDRKGRWYLNDSSHFLFNADDPAQISLKHGNTELALIPGSASKQLISVKGKKTVGELDVIFPVLHGPYGEDGTVQGLLRMADIAFVGADVLGSAVSMDKDVMKRLLRDAGIPQAKFISFSLSDRNLITFEKVDTVTGIPCFVKPANLGSSVGISKVHNKEEFEPALKKAFEFDDKIVIEQYIEGREIECSVLGNDNPVASLPGEVMPSHEFYSYEAKYLDQEGAKFQIPAVLPEEILKRIQEMAIKTFKVLNCESMARIDFFLKGTDEIYVNELNSIPGFTKISMYPKLWEASGISYSELFDRLIQLALERHQRRKSK
jgi:D-alanine-D-alanine ligase